MKQILLQLKWSKVILLFVPLAITFFFVYPLGRAQMQVELETVVDSVFQVYWADAGQNYSESRSVSVRIKEGGPQKYTLYLPDLEMIHRLRIDPTQKASEIIISSLVIKQIGYEAVRFSGKDEFSRLIPLYDILNIDIQRDGLNIISSGEDPQLEISIAPIAENHLCFLIHYAIGCAKLILLAFLLSAGLAFGLKIVATIPISSSLFGVKTFFWQFYKRKKYSSILDKSTLTSWNESIFYMNLFFILIFLFAVIAFTHVELHVLFEKSDVWKTEGVFIRNGEYPSNKSEFWKLRPQIDDKPFLWASHAGSDKNTGQIVSPDFLAPSKVGILIVGYPLHPQNRIYFEQINTGKKIPFVLFNPGNKWKKISINLPKKWQQTRIRLVAIDNATNSCGWLGLSTPFAIPWWWSFKQYSHFYLAFSFLLFLMHNFIPSSMLGFDSLSLNNKDNKNGTRKKLFGLIGIILGLIPLIAVSFSIASFPNVPLGDTAMTNGNIAVSFASGTFKFNELLSIDQGSHINFFSKVVTVMATYLTNWDIRFQKYIIVFIALLNNIIFISLYKKYHVQTSSIVIPIFSLLTFSLTQKINWWWGGVESAWFFVIFFLLLSIWLLNRFTISWLVLIVVAFLALCSMLSFTSGILAWPLLLIYIYIRGYRQKRFILFWIVFASINIGFYLYQITHNVKFQERPIMGVEIYDCIHFVLAYLGSPLLYISNAESRFESVQISAIIGLTGVILLIINICYLWIRVSRAKIQIWLIIALYSIGTGIMISLSRQQWKGPLRAIYSQYETASISFWMALFATIVMVLWYTFHHSSKNWWKAIFFKSNLCAAIIISVLYFYANYLAFNEYHKHLQIIKMDAKCYFNYPLDRNYSCIKFPILPSPDKIDLFAKLRIGGFGQQKKVNIIDNCYIEGTPIIIASPFFWQSKYIQYYLLKDIPEENVYHMAEMSQQKIDGNYSVNSTKEFVKRIETINSFLYLGQVNQEESVKQVFKDADFINVYEQTVKQTEFYRLIKYVKNIGYPYMPKQSIVCKN